MKRLYLIECYVIIRLDLRMDTQQNMYLKEIGLSL